MPGQSRSSRLEMARDRRGCWRSAACIWVIALALASCQGGAEDQAAGQAYQSGYPSLYTVPPRPQLTYPVEQRRAVIEGLIADRENARYTDQTVRYRAGLSGLPPPATPPATPPAASPDQADGAGLPSAPEAEPDRPVVSGGTDRLYDDDDSLGTFLNDLERERAGQPDQAAPWPESNAAPHGTAVVRAGARAVSTPVADNGRAPGVVWGIPAGSDPRAAPPAATAIRQAASPAADRAPVVGGAPAVVWGMVDGVERPAVPHGTQVAALAGETDGATAPPRQTSRESTYTGEAKPARPEPTDPALAGRAPGVVWGMVNPPKTPPAPVAVEPEAQIATAPEVIATSSDADGRNEAPENAEAGAAPAVAEPEVQIAAAPEVIPPPSDVDGRNGAGEDPEANAAPAAPAHVDRPLQLAAATPGIEVSDGLIALAPASATDAAGLEGSITFAPGSAVLPPDADARLERFLAAAKGAEARIKVVGAADAPALALDRALAVGVALVQRGVPAERVELTMAWDAAGDETLLSLVESAP